MPDLDLAIEHLRMTIATAHAVEAAQTIVNVGELAALLAEHDRLRVLFECATTERTWEADGIPPLVIGNAFPHPQGSEIHRIGNRIEIRPADGTASD